MKKNDVSYFYQLFSDIKNNIDTLIQDDLVEFKKDNASYEVSKGVALKSKLPDMAKLWFVSKRTICHPSKYQIAPLWDLILKTLEFGRISKETQAIVLSSVLEYSYKWLRPYALLLKFLLVYHKNKWIDRQTFISYLTMDIDSVVQLFKTHYTPDIDRNIQIISYNDLYTYASRPYSYIINYLFYAWLIDQDNQQIRIKESIGEDILSYINEDHIDLNRFSKQDMFYQYVNRRWASQIEFRKWILDIYGRKCAMTDNYFDFWWLTNLEAAHIVPVSHWGSYDLNNWLLLSRDLHYAYDRWAIWVNENYKIVVHKKVIDDWFLSFLDWADILLPEDKTFRPSKASLAYHMGHVFGKWI